MLLQDNDDKIDTPVVYQEQTLRFSNDDNMVARVPTSSSDSSLTVMSNNTLQNDEDSRRASLKCPRCDSTNTKFCYYNNYKQQQPRHLCKDCRRYWTEGGALRNVPVGGGCRKNKRIIKHRTTYMNPAGGLFEPTSYMESLALLGTTLPSFPVPTSIVNDSGCLPLLNMDSFSSLKETMYAPHLGQSPSLIDMGSTRGTNCTIHGGACVDTCTCASSMSKQVDASTCYKVMPPGLIEQRAYDTFYNHSNHIAVGGLMASNAVCPLDRVSSISNVLPLNSLAPGAGDAALLEPNPLRELHAQQENAPLLKPVPPQELRPRQENISLSHFELHLESDDPLVQYSQGPENTPLEQIQQEEESAFMSKFLNEVQGVFDAHDDQPCHDNSAVHRVDGEAKLREEPFVSFIDVPLLSPTTNEMMLQNEPHHKASWSNIEYI